MGNNLQCVGKRDRFDNVVKWFEAAETGDRVTLQKCISEGIDVNIMKNRIRPKCEMVSLEGITMTALSVVARDGNVDLVEFLLQNGATAVLGHQRSTPLALAVAGGHIECVKMLISHGIPMSGNNAIELAADYGHAKILEILLDHVKVLGPSKDDSKTMHIMNHALVRACGHKHVDCVEMLLKAKADVNATVYFSERVCCMHRKVAFSPLEVAAGTCNQDMVKRLLKHGAQLTMREYSPVNTLVRWNDIWGGPWDHIDSIHLHCDSDNPSMPLFQKAITIWQKTYSEDQVSAMLHLLVQHGASVNQMFQDRSGHRPLHRAMVGHHSSVKVAKTLIELGADMNLRVPSNEGWELLPINYIIYIYQTLQNCRYSFKLNMNRKETIKYLIKEGHQLEKSSNAPDNILYTTYMRQKICTHCTVDPKLTRWLVDILLASGVHAHYLLANKKIADGLPQEIHTKLANSAKTPETLKNRARDVIRCSLATPKLRKINTLPLPKALVSYLKIEDLDYVVDEQCST